MIDEDTFRDALGGVCTPVAVVTSAVGGRVHGTTVSAFSALSLRPPLVLVSLDRDSDLLAVVRQAGAFAINVLEHDQQQLAIAFARKGSDKFAEASWSLERGLPRLAGIGLWLACDIHEFVPGGDHIIVVGLVQATDHDTRKPLLYRRRAFGTLAPLVI